jgi:hypothetical protein
MTTTLLTTSPNFLLPLLHSQSQMGRYLSQKVHSSSGKVEKNHELETESAGAVHLHDWESKMKKFGIGNGAGAWRYIK